MSYGGSVDDQITRIKLELDRREASHKPAPAEPKQSAVTQDQPRPRVLKWTTVGPGSTTAAQFHIMHSRWISGGDGVGSSPVCALGSFQRQRGLAAKAGPGPTNTDPSATASNGDRTHTMEITQVIEQLRAQLAETEADAQRLRTAIEALEGSVESRPPRPALAVAPVAAQRAARIQRPDRRQGGAHA